jgi:hypothetical protein
MTELEKVFLLSIARGLERALTIAAARKWIKANCEKSTLPSKTSLYHWKNRFTNRSRWYLRSDAMAQAFTDCGFRVEGQAVFCKERK